MAEGLINHFGKDDFQAFSAGSKPTGYVHPMSIKNLFYYFRFLFCIFFFTRQRRLLRTKKPTQILEPHRQGWSS